MKHFRIFVLLFILTNCHLYADKEGPQNSYVTSSINGRFYFRMEPDLSAPFDRKKGSGTLFEVQNDGNDVVLWKTEGWYSFKTFICHEGRYLVRIGNWPRGRELSDTHLAIAFYDKGILLKKYSTKQLIENPKTIKKSVSHYFFINKVIGFDPSYSHQFKLETIDGRTHTFDVKTGNKI